MGGNAPISDVRCSIGSAPGAAVHRFPDFLCIGAQKAGTTWLDHNLRYHPDIWLPPVKELQYFNELYVPSHRTWPAEHRHTQGNRVLEEYLEKVDRATWDCNFIERTRDIISGSASDEWYGRIFTLAAPTQICGEMTPEYSLLPRAGIEHIVRLIPDVKIVLSLRDPIERSWSHLRTLARSRGREPEQLRRLALSFDVAERGNYPQMLRLWSELFPPERLSIIFMDDIAADPFGVLERVCGFLGIEFREEYFPHSTTPIHVTEAMAIPPELYETLKEQMRPIYDELEPRFPDIVKRWVARHYG
jgi:hypothetical protein